MPDWYSLSGCQIGILSHNIKLVLSQNTRLVFSLRMPDWYSLSGCQIGILSHNIKLVLSQNTRLVFSLRMPDWYSLSGCQIGILSQDARLVFSLRIPSLYTSSGYSSLSWPIVLSTQWFTAITRTYQSHHWQKTPPFLPHVKTLQPLGFSLGPSPLHLQCLCLPASITSPWKL